MSLLTSEEREALLIEYEHLHDENWRRGQNVWVVNSILITSSLLVAFQHTVQSFLTYVIPLILVLVAFSMHITTDKITNLCYERMNEIGKMLKIYGPERTYRSGIEGQWWYPIRTNLAYCLYLVLATAYLFLLLHRPLLPLTTLFLGIGIMVLWEIYKDQKREEKLRKS